MADPLSMAASIAGLMSLADTAFRYVFKYARGVVGAKKEVESLSAEINALAGVLRSLHALASELEAEASFEPTLRMQHLIHCKQSLETIKNRVKKAADDFDNKAKWEGITRRLKWPFSVSETKDLLSDISRCKETLTLATSADTMRKLQICLANQEDLDRKLDKKLDNITDILERDEVNVRKRLVLDFFMKPEANPKANLSQSLRLRHPTTGSWLTLSHAFKTWLDTPGSRLWLNGIPGGGKTVLAGAVIEEALSARSPDIAVAFFFCDYKNKATLAPVNILGAIASQIARQKDDAFDLLQDYYQELHPARALDRVADADELRASITKMSELFRQTIIVIDGLDECGENTDSVLDSISELSVSTTTTSLALFSRDELNIRTWLHEEFEEVSIEAHKEDIELFVRAEMEQRIQNNRLKVSNLKIKDEIGEELITRANGMFRWVVCQLDYLCEFATDADRRNALKELPPTLPDSYRRLLERLNRRPARVQRMVQMSLQFIAFFPEPLSVKALCQAVSTPEARIDETNTVSERDIVLGCSSLIRRSPDGESLEFAHFSVLEFLQDDILSRTPGLEAYRLSGQTDCKVLAAQCLRFLQLENFNYIPSHSTEWDQFREEQRQSYPFYREATFQWPKLAREGLDDSLLLDEVKSLFRPSMTQTFRGWVEFFLGRMFHSLYDEDENNSNPFSECIIYLRSLVLDQKLRPLHIAAALNLPEICSFLIGEGADVNEECDMGTPLLLAELSLLALKNKKVAFPDCQSPILKSFLPCPSRRNRTISCLIQAGASFVKNSEYSATVPLFLTTSIIDCHIKDFSPTIQLLEQSISPMDSETDEFEAYLKTWTRIDNPNELETPLLALVQYLKRSSAYKFDWGLKLGRGLWSACSKLDFAFTSDPTLTDSRISLSHDALIEKTVVAIRNDDVDALTSYLDDERIDVHSSYSYSNFEGTLLSFAVRADSPVCTDKLLALGSDPHSKDDHGRVAVHHCCCHGDGKILKLLVRSGVSLLAEDGNGENLWHYSSKRSWTASFMDVLFNLSKDDTWKALLMRNRAGQTPLMIALSHQKHATEEDREECEWRALMFIDYCNQVPRFWTQHDPLFPAVFKFASRRVFEKLKELGLEPDALIPGQATPLHELGSEASIEWVETLKESYPSACSVRFEGRLPLEAYLEAILWVGECPDNMKDVIQVLASPDIFKLRDQGTTPWEFACGLLLRVEHWNEGRKRFLKDGWRVLDEMWTDLMALGAMEAHENAVGQCGLYPLLSALVHTCSWLSNGTGLLSNGMLDKAILASRLWDREEEVVVRFFKQAIKDREITKVRLLLKHGLNVHQRAGETTAIEYACTPPCVTMLCTTDDGQRVLQCLLDHSDPERLRDFTPDREGLGLLHRVAASDSTNPGFGWLLRQLLNKGALDINAMNPALDGDWRVTPMAYHIEQRSFYTAACLLEMGADPSLGDLFDATYFAALRGNLDLLRGILGYSRANQNKIDWKKSYTWLLSDGEGKPLECQGNCLHMVCHLGSLECAKFFIEEGLIEPRTLTVGDGTPLHLAAEKGSVNIVNYLVSIGSGVNVMTTKNSTPLHFAASNGQLEVVKALVGLGASSSIDEYGMSPRVCAYSRGHHDIVQFLDEVFRATNDLERHAEMQRKETRAHLQRMKAAIRLGDLAAFSACLASGCPLDEGIPGTGGWSPLDYAVVKGQESMVQLLLEYGASTLVPFNRGKNLYDGALHCASESEKHTPVLPFLLSRYLQEANSVHELGWPLMYAIAAGNEKGFRVILEHLVRSSQEISQTSQIRSEDVVRQILDHFLPHEMPGPGPQRFRRMSPLHATVRRGQLPMAALLLEHGANVDCIDETASTPLHCASSLEMASLLVKSGASLVPIFTETTTDLCLLWGPNFANITKLCFANGLEDTSFQVSDLLEHPIAPPPAMPSQNYLASILALEDMGLSSPNRRCDDDALMLLLQKGRANQSYILNSEFSLDSLAPFSWYLEGHCTFQELPFLRRTFRQFRRRFHRGSLKRWINLQPDRGWSPLCRAASQDLITVMENCMSLDAEIDFEGCPLGSALMVASACGSLEAVKLLIRRGAVTSYFGRRGYIDVLSVARSASVRSWLLVGRFNEQLRISTGEETSSTPPVQMFPWSGIVQARLRHVGIGGRLPEESTIDYAKYLATVKKEMRGRVATNIDGWVYADDVGTSGMAGPIPVLKENHVEQRVEAGTDMDTLYTGSSETSPAMLTVNKNYEEPWVLDLARGEYHQPGQLGFVVNIQSQTGVE